MSRVHAGAMRVTKLASSDIVNRRSLEASQVVSGSWFERAALKDGRRVVLKHLPAEGDWLTRMSNGSGRARSVWEQGVLAQVAEHIDHAVLAVWREDDHDVVVMDDVSAFLLARGTRLTAAAADGVLGGLASLHRGLEGSDLPGLCSSADRHRIAAPSFHREDTGPHPCPFRSALFRGWEQFDELVPDDVATAILAVHDDTDALGEHLRDAAPATLLHGDAKLGNIGLRDGRLVLIDWGELTGTGPAELDVTWFAATSTLALPGETTWAVDAMPDDVFRAYEVHAGRRLEKRVLDLACIGQLAQQGFILAALAVHAPDSTKGVRAARLLDWWVNRVRDALDTWAPSRPRHDGAST